MHLVEYMMIQITNLKSPNGTTSSKKTFERNESIASNNPTESSSSNQPTESSSSNRPSKQ